jgi:sugar phosphate isomerase/epimerase
LQLVEFAEMTSAPIVSCHGYVGRVRAVENGPAEEIWMIEATRQIAQSAAARGVRVAIELLNRYESHLLNTVDQGLAFLQQVDAANVGLLLDAYHMNIEENDLLDAIMRAGDNLLLFHAADSNRQAIGRGHTDFAAIVRGLDALPYRGDIVFECTAPGPDPFRATKDFNSPRIVEEYLRESLGRMKGYLKV